ncbi:MAG TPA: hypothetical protein VMZ30_06975 [Pyrinomonadaceae bacterium]|nr:hypothetical protein [Pyrinomonadaceae bacterium]
MSKALVNVEKDTVITNLSKCVELLGKCTRVEEAKKLMDIGDVAKVWAERQKLGVEAQNSATEFVIRAERHIGELLKETERHQGGRPGKKPVTRRTGF